jgi:hypothetical protein
MRNSSGTPLGIQAWSPVKIGGLGYCTGLVLNSAGMWCRTDVGGAYRWDAAAGKWVQMISAASMTLPDPLTVIGNRFGCFELSCGAGSSTNLRMAFRSHIFKSTDGGQSWTDTNINGSTGLYMGSNDQTSGNVRIIANKLVQDPSNDDVAYFGSQADALWREMSGSWSQIASVPASSLTNAARVIIIAIDPTSALVGSGATSRRSAVYASVAGKGLYQSTDGGTTFSLLASASSFSSAATLSCTTTSGSAVVTMASTTGLTAQMGISGTGIPANSAIVSVDSSTQITISANATASGTNNLAFYAIYQAWFLNFDASGKLWLCLNNGGGQNVWTYASSTWTQLSLPFSEVVRSIRVDPKDATRWVAQKESGCPALTKNSGGTWQVWNTPNQSSTAENVPIIASVLNTTFLGGQSASFADIIPHPVENYDYVPMGLGICRFANPWPATVSTSNKLVWLEHAAGIEELVANSVLITPNGRTLVGSQDKAIIQIPTSGYPAQSYPPASLDTGFGMDYAADNNDWIVAIANNQAGGQLTGLSSDGGANFLPFTKFLSCTTTSGSAVVTTASTIGLYAGQHVTGTGIPTNTNILSVDSSTQITLSANATASATGTLTFAPTAYLGGSVAVGNQGDVHIFPGQNARPKVSNDSGAIFATPTFVGFTQPANGTENGWGFGTSNTRRFIVRVDKANPSKVFAYNYGCPSDGAGGANSKGLWKSVDRGNTYNRVARTDGGAASIIDPLFVGFHAQLLHDRGILYLCPGESGDSYNGDATNLTYRTEDEGLTWTVLGELYEINLLAITKPLPGSSVHTLLALGWKTILGVPTFGFYRSVNKGANWTLLTNSTSFDHAYAMAADPIKFGRAIVGRTGTGNEETNYQYRIRLKAA